MTKMSFYTLEPEVAGGWGTNTIADTSQHPPRVKELHYEFDGWLGDGIVETFPCFIVTNELEKAIEEARLTGYETCEVEISASEEFKEIHPEKDLPPWRWLKPVGVAGKDDIALTDKGELIVSAKTLSVFREHGLDSCEISGFIG